MNKQLYFAGCIVVLMSSGGVYAKKPKKHSFFSFPPLPSVSLQLFYDTLSELNPFDQKDIVLVSDLQESEQKKQKQKKGKNKFLSMVAAIQAAPGHLYHTKRVQQLLQKAQDIHTSIVALGPETMRYASSERGKGHIKALLKNGLFYGVPLLGIIGGFKWLDMRHEKRSQVGYSKLQELDTRLDTILKGMSQSNMVVEHHISYLRRVAELLMECGVEDEDGNLDGYIPDLFERSKATLEILGTVNERLKQACTQFQSAAENINNLHSYLEDEQRTEVKKDIKSPEEAFDYCKNNLSSYTRMQSIFDTQQFKLNSPIKLIGKNKAVYTVIPVEVTQQTYDKPSALWGWQGNLTYQNTYKAHQQKIESVKTDLGENEQLMFWYRDPDVERGYSVITPRHVPSSGKEEAD